MSVCLSECVAQESGQDCENKMRSPERSRRPANSINCAGAHFGLSWPRRNKHTHTHTHKETTREHSPPVASRNIPPPRTRRFQSGAREAERAGGRGDNGGGGGGAPISDPTSDASRERLGGRPGRLARPLAQRAPLAAPLSRSNLRRARARQMRASRISNDATTTATTTTTTTTTATTTSATRTA